MANRKTQSLSVDTDEQNIMDISIGSDGEQSVTHASPPLKVASGKRLSSNFSIENILRPEFGLSQERGHIALNRLSVSSAFSSGSSAGLPSPGSPAPSFSSPEPSALNNSMFLPAWVYCTRYSDRPSSGPRSRKTKRQAKIEEKRPRTAFTPEQLAKLKTEFQENRYLTEKRRMDMANTLGLKESQIKIWFQNKRAKLKKQVGNRNPLALHLMAQGLYNHSTVSTRGNSPTDPDMLQEDDSISNDEDFALQEP